MLHIWNKRVVALLRSRRFAPGCALVLLITAGCSGSLTRPPSDAGLRAGGLAVGFVTNAGESTALKPYQRSRYANRLASAILDTSPQLSGKVDSYAYVAARVGDATFKDVINSYRLEGSLSPRAKGQLKSAQLRRRYLMLATISGVDEKIEFPVEITSVAGPSNPDLDDYQEVQFQTVRLKAVRVQIYDVPAGRKILDKIYSSDDQDIMLASERTGRRYVGNSLLGALANSVSNRIKRTSDVNHPPAPTREQTLDHLWRRIALDLPGSHSL